MKIRQGVLAAGASASSRLPSPLQAYECAVDEALSSALMVYLQQSVALAASAPASTTAVMLSLPSECQEVPPFSPLPAHIALVCVYSAYLWRALLLVCTRMQSSAVVCMSRACDVVMLSCRSACRVECPDYLLRLDGVCMLTCRVYVCGLHRR